MHRHNSNGNDFKAYIFKFQHIKNQLNKCFSNMQHNTLLHNYIDSIHYYIRNIFLPLHNFFSQNQKLYFEGILSQKPFHFHICRRHHIAPYTDNFHLLFPCTKAEVQYSCSRSESRRDGHIHHCMGSFERSTPHHLDIDLF